MLLVLLGCFAQPPPRPCSPATCGKPDQDLPDQPDPLPVGRTRDLIVKSDYKKNLEDSMELARLAEDLKSQLENGDKNVVSVKAMKTAEDIEKLARHIRGRLKR